jgi:hypothetical protein
MNKKQAKKILNLAEEWVKRAKKTGRAAEIKNNHHPSKQPAKNEIVRNAYFAAIEAEDQARIEFVTFWANLIEEE